MSADRQSRAAAKAQTREALLQAGLEELAERGLDAPSLDDICARAGYTRGAFYVHFEDRDDFRSAVMELVLGRFLDAVIATDDRARDLSTTIGRFVEAILGLSAGKSLHALGHTPAIPDVGAFHRVLEACHSVPSLRERFVALMGEAIERVAKAAEEGQSEGTVREDVDARGIATALVAMAVGAIPLLELQAPIDVEGTRDAVLALVRK